MVKPIRTVTSGVRDRWAAMLLVWLCLAQGAQAEDIPINLDNDESRIVVKSIVIATGGEGTLKTSRLQELTRLALRERSKYPQAISIDELHQIADVLTLAVRKEGYNFDSLYLPPQTVSNGVLHFRYQKTILASVNVINNTEFSDQRLTVPFKPLLGKRVFAPHIENVVYALQAQPTLSVFAFYSRGKREDEVVLNLRVDTRAQPGYSLRLENYGSESTGKHRVVGELKGRNILSALDQATLAVLATHGEGNTAYGYLHYRYVLANMNTSVEFGAGDTRYALGRGFEQLEASGASQSVRVDMNRIVSHNPKNKWEIGLGALYKASEFSSDDPLFNAALGRNEQSYSAAMSARGQRNGKKWSLAMGANLIAGQFTLADDADAELLLKAEYHLFTSLMINGASRFALQPRFFVRGQQADQTPLPSIETLSLSGFYGVRASPIGFASADSGMLASAELHFPKLVAAPVLNKRFVLAPYVFYDLGRGDQYQVDADPISVDLSGFGAGVSARWGRLSANVTFATAKSNSDRQEGQGDDQAYFQLRWQ